jgi:hypothetical protein
VRLDHLLSRERELELAVGISAKDPPRLIVTIVSVVPAGWGAADEQRPAAPRSRRRTLDILVRDRDDPAPNTEPLTQDARQLSRAGADQPYFLSLFKCWGAAALQIPIDSIRIWERAPGGRLAQLVRALP